MHIDGDDLREIFNNKDYSKEGRIRNITFAQGLAKFLHKKDMDVVVSLVAPYKEIRDSFKSDMGTDLIEIYVHRNLHRGWLGLLLENLYRSLWLELVFLKLKMYNLIPARSV